MRWDYRQPEAKLFVSDGRQFFLYVPAEKQVTRSAAKSTEDFRAPLGVLLSRLSLRRVFSKIEFADQALQAEAGNRVLRGYPKKEFEDEYREVLIELTPQMDIRRLVVFYADNSTMEFTFDRIERNVVMPPSLFRFVPPADAEVIQE
jgi:outer membrane lipoprotein carrier protein